MFVFVVIPLVDLVDGRDPSNPPDEVLDRLESDPCYRWVSCAFIPLQYVALVWTAWMLSQPQYSVTDRIGMALPVGKVAGIATGAAHELGPKKESHERWLAKVALTQTFYGYSCIEHNRDHHVRVSTSEDPASARMGENVWSFMPRTVSGSLRSAWGLEKNFGRLGRSHWSIRERRAQLLAAVGGAVGRPDGGLRHRRPPLPRDPGRDHRLDAGVGQLETFLAVVRDRFEAETEFVAAVRSAVEGALVTAERVPLLRSVLESDQNGDAGLLPFIVQSQWLVDRATEFMVDLVTGRHPDLPLPADRLRVVLESVVRLVLSHVTRPSRPPEETADDLAFIVAAVLAGTQVSSGAVPA